MRRFVLAVTAWVMTGGNSKLDAMRRALLRVAVHADAARRAPRAWLLAVWWRICGKRLRSRSQMAPLIGSSPHAYRLWLMSRSDAGCRSVHPGGGAPIIALVEDGPGIERTLASLKRENIKRRQGPASIQLPGCEATWVMPLEAGDELARGAGDAYRTAAAQAGPDMHAIYADDDILVADGTRTGPHFKPDWNAELFEHHDYVTGASLLRVDPGILADLPREEWAKTLTRRAVTRHVAGRTAPRHLRAVLHHRRARPAPRRPATVDDREEAEQPSVTVIIPTRNRVDLLRTCLQGLAETRYAGALDVIVIDNDSDDPEALHFLNKLDPGWARVLRHPGPFNFAAMNNRAIERASGRLVCLLNNDIEMRDPMWLATLVRQAVRPDVGAVGPQLLYPDGRIQHAGVVLGVGGGAAHAHRLLHPDEEGYFQRHALPQFVSAVTAACLVVERSRVLAVGGLDAEHFAVAFNDVDLCLKLNGRGWQSFYEPRASLIHHESVSRGLDRDPVGASRLARELAALKKRWGTGMAADSDAGPSVAVDPFHHPHLSPFSERFVVGI